MRIRATVAAVSGALALSALALPAAHAADGGSSYRAAVADALARHTSGKAGLTATAAPMGDLDVSFSDFRIAKAVKVGTTNHVSTTVTYTLTHPADLDPTDDGFATGPLIYRGSQDNPDNVLGGDDQATCVKKTSTTATCKGPVDIDPREADPDMKLFNTQAGTWHGAGFALDLVNDKSAFQLDLGTTLVQRASTLTVNASPEPVTKGKTLTVTGKLARANWEDHKYHGYTGQPVKLQFRKSGSSTYTTLKTVTTDSTGGLRTTTTASADGYYRFTFAGTTTTPTATATGDFVDVR